MDPRETERRVWEANERVTADSARLRRRRRGVTGEDFGMFLGLLVFGGGLLYFLLKAILT